MKGIDTVSIERIYQHIWADKKANGTLYINLKKRGKNIKKEDLRKNLEELLKIGLV